MFVDQADIQVSAGDGGKGCVSMRKESMVPMGGPDGGDGGDGGSVYLQSVHGVDTLLDMVGRHHWRAERGGHGLGKKCAGSDGKDLTIKVPPGTLVYDAESGLLIADLKEPNRRVLVAKGGRGGKGNFQFTTAVRQAPDFAEPGGKGGVRSLRLELRLIADVGFVGMPNAGKSTLLSHLSAARPKIADYPFTTLVPQIGIAPLDSERRLVLADIPGLIEGAAEGKGLGLDFLRHIERTRVIVHIVDILPVESGGGALAPIEAYRKIRKELEKYSPKLAAKAEILVANKMDLSGAQQALADLRSELPGKLIYAISAVAGSGLKPLLEALWNQVQLSPPSEPFLDKPPALVPLRREEAGPEFIYVENAADPAEWEPVDGENDVLDAAPRAIPKKPGKGKKRAPRLMIEAPQFGKRAKREKGKKRVTAADRKKMHDKRVAKKLAPPVAEKPADAELAAEIAAMKADDVRKSKFYSRKREG